MPRTRTCRTCRCHRPPGGEDRRRGQGCVTRPFTGGEDCGRGRRCDAWEAGLPAGGSSRLLAVAVMLLGIGFSTVITAAITSTFVARPRLEAAPSWRQPCGGAVASDREATRWKKSRPR